MSLVGLLLTSICALLPSPAQAQCKRWDVSGKWLIHENDGTNLQVNLQQGEWQQTSANLTGTGRLTSTTSTSEGRPDLAADVEGNITDNSVAMKVTLGKFIIRYVGTIGPDGKIQGDCHYENGRSSHGINKITKHWYSVKKMTCADANPQRTEASSTSESSSNDSDDQQGKHGKHKKNKKKHHHHDDDDQNQDNN